MRSASCLNQLPSGVPVKDGRNCTDTAAGGRGLSHPSRNSGNVIGKPMIVVAADHSTFFPASIPEIHARRVWMIHAAVKQITKQIQVVVLFEINFFQQFHEPPAVVMYIGNNIVHPKSPFLSQLSCLLLQSSKLSLSAHFSKNGFPACVLACPVSKIFPLVLLVSGFRSSDTGIMERLKSFTHCCPNCKTLSPVSRQIAASLPPGKHAPQSMAMW